MSSLNEIANMMIAKGKGVLAADESTGTCTKRFEQVGIDPTEENRRLYRQTLLTTPDLNKYIGGIILFDETLRQSTDDNTSFADYLLEQNILPGIKVDTGVKKLANFPEEKHTSGLDGLPERLAEYAKLGAKFAKWREVIVIDETKNLPTTTALRTIAHELAMYANLCQEAGLVPIVEPELIMDGNHTIEACKTATIKTLTAVFEELKNHKVALDGIVLKPSMVIAGKDCPQQASTEEVAKATVEVLKECVPSEVPGIAFLSGGQTEIQATEHLQAMNKLNPDLPWNLTFSYGRALQSSALKYFADGQINEAQKTLIHRAEMNGTATKGDYESNMEK